MAESRLDSQILSISRRAVVTPIDSGGENVYSLNSFDSPLAAIREVLLKRPVEFILASIGLLVSTPLWVIVALTIKLVDRGPVLYTQERWGRGGQKFRVYKFRTMEKNSNQESTLNQASENGHRVTPVGRFLRATGMDELPQLLNILRGEMSFVGPRALAVGEIVEDERGYHSTYEHISGFRERLAVRPGLTSLATVYLTKDVSPRRKFRYDTLYIRKQSIWLDLYLITLSFWISFRGKWEIRERKLGPLGKRLSTDSLWSL